MKLMGDSRPRHEELDKQTRTLLTIDLPRQRFGEYYFVPELKIRDRLTGRLTDRHRYFLSCCATKKQYSNSTLEDSKFTWYSYAIATTYCNEITNSYLFQTLLCDTNVGVVDSEVIVLVK